MTQIRLTTAVDGWPETRLGWFTPKVIISDDHHTGFRKYVLRYLLVVLWLWTGYVFVTHHRFTEFDMLWWLLVENRDSVAAWEFVRDVSPWLLASYSVWFGPSGLVSLLLWWLTKKRTRIVVTPDWVIVGRIWRKRYQLHSGDKAGVNGLHRLARWEQRREDKKQRRAMARGQDNLPMMPMYYRQTFKVDLENQGQVRPLTAIYGEEKAVQFAERVLWALEFMKGITPETDWKEAKRKIRGLKG